MPVDLVARSNFPTLRQRILFFPCCTYHVTHILLVRRVVTKAVVAERGQVTIPKALRDKLGIRQGTTLEFAASNGTLVARKAETDPVSSVFGCLRKRMDSDKFVRKIRGDANA